jgi:hypothetical protein
MLMPIRPSCSENAFVPIYPENDFIDKNFDSFSEFSELDKNMYYAFPVIYTVIRFLKAVAMVVNRSHSLMLTHHLGPKN